MKQETVSLKVGIHPNADDLVAIIDPSQNRPDGTG